MFTRFCQNIDHSKWAVLGVRRVDMGADLTERLGLDNTGVYGVYRVLENIAILVKPLQKCQSYWHPLLTTH